MKAKIVFTEPDDIGFFGKLVRWAIGGKFSHVHFLFESNSGTWTYEAYPPRVRMVKQDLYPNQGVAIELPLTHHQILVLRDQAIEESQNKLYSANNALRIFVRNRISKKLAKWLGKLQLGKGETCSTLGVKTLQLMWPDFGGVDALEFSPDELHAAVLDKQKAGW